MSKTLLWVLAAVCFIVAAITYTYDGRVLIVGMQVVAGVMMPIVAFKSARKA